jgi:FtsP/CotA-like multicopper oxidase with cupredoxin domain
MMSERYDAPAEAMLGTLYEGQAQHKMWSDPITENPAIGATETWEFYNFTPDAHPMHIHDAQFQVVDRQSITFDEHMGHIQGVQTSGAPRSPEPWENGWKETVVAYPGEATRVRMQFETAGQFVWHCHIVEHEDNEMMRPFHIG